MVRRRNLHSSRQVENDTIVTSTRFTPRRFDSFADLDSEFWFSLGESLWAVFIFENGAVFCRALFRYLPHELGMLHCELNCLFL